MIATGNQDAWLIVTSSLPIIHGAMRNWPLRVVDAASAAEHSRRGNEQQQHLYLAPSRGEK